MRKRLSRLAPNFLIFLLEFKASLGLSLFLGDDAQSLLAPESI
jgi:hypothetical protein